MISQVISFHTKIDKPIILQNTQAGLFEYVQPKGYIESKGIEANLKFGYKDFKLFTGYTFVDVTRTENGNTFEKKFLELRSRMKVVR